MSNRRKDEGEEQLQLQLLEVTQDPTFEHVPQHDRWPVIRSKMESDIPGELPVRTVKVVH